MMNSNDKKLDIALKISNKLNDIEESSEVLIPILDDFKIVEENKGTLKFLAINDENVIEQFLIDGFLNKNEKLEDRIKSTINATIEFSKDKEYVLTEDNVKLVDINNILDFKYYIYVQDFWNNKSIIRNVIAYFTNPKTNEFCQLSLSCGPLEINEKIKLISNIKIEDFDYSLNNMLKMLNNIINNIKFKI